MRLNDERAQRARLDVQEAFIRAVVREEIVNALGALSRASDDLDVPYETGDLESSALMAIGKAADNAVGRLTCPHEEYVVWTGPSRCRRCGEPEPEQKNPFEEENHG